jgi:hypothetical protein
MRRLMPTVINVDTDISSGNVNAQHMANNYVDNLSVDRHLQVACFVYELVRLVKKYLYIRAIPICLVTDWNK